MARRPPQPTNRPSLTAWEAKIRDLAADLGTVVHTHTARVPYGGDVGGAVTDPAALGGQRARGAFVASTTIEGPHRLAVAVPPGAIGVAMALGNDMGLAGGRTPLDLALDRDADVLQQAGLSAATADALCQGAAALKARAPGEPLADQPTLFFEANGEQVALTPLVSVRVLQQINVRLADAGRSSQARLALSIAQGGANPQNVAHYVNASPSPRREDELLVNRNTRRGHYNALRVRCPIGPRSRLDRDLARAIATRSLASVCRVEQDAARAYRGRAVTGLLLPGAATRSAAVRAAERRDAGDIARCYLAPLQAIRAHLHDDREQGYALDRLSGPARFWLEGRVTTQDWAVLLGELAEDLIRKVELAARGALPPASCDALRVAMAEVLGEAA